MLCPGIVIISYLQGTKKWTELPKSVCPAAGDPTPPATCPDTELRLEAAVQNTDIAVYDYGVVLL